MPNAEKNVLDILARALAKADGKVWWTESFPAAYRDQAARLLADGWRVTPPAEPAFSCRHCDYTSDEYGDTHTHVTPSGEGDINA